MDPRTMGTQVVRTPMRRARRGFFGKVKARELRTCCGETRKAKLTVAKYATVRREVILTTAHTVIFRDVTCDYLKWILTAKRSM
jgi:hypothetical protein